MAARALELAQRAVAGAAAPNASLWDTLAVAQAGAGDFNGAAATGERARALAVAGGDLALAERIEGRLRLYREWRAYRE